MEVSGGGSGRVVPALAALVVALAVTPAGAGAANTDWTKLRTLNIAHQGGEDEAPSNTMYAYERSLRLGADMLEVDVHTTSDGELVALHDATVDRTTNGTGRIYDKTLAEVRELDAAHNLVPGEGTERGLGADNYPYRGVRLGEREPPRGFGPEDFRIPALAETIAAYPDVPINIEIKGAADTDAASFQRNAQALAAYLNELGRTEGIMVASFNDAALDTFHDLAPQIDLAPAIAAVAAYKLSGAKPPEGTAAFQVPIEFNGVSVTDQSFVDRVHADGYGIHLWTINDPAEMNMLLDWGVDGIMTAEPIRLEQVLCERGVARPPRPPSAPGEHCSKRSSIACDVEPVQARRTGRSLRITLRRQDDFAGRCAGRLTASAPDDRALSATKFALGELPPAEGGKAKVLAEIELSRKLRRLLEPGEMAKLKARPYLAFAERAELTVR
ncbi:MAG: glycerophosphodiester phosphodiesterase [Solirubrobacterales bacterium]